MTTTRAPAVGAVPPSARRRQRGAVGLVLCSIVSLQTGAALSTGLFPLVGAAGASTLRLAIASIVLLALTRPALRRWTGQQCPSVTLLGFAMAGMNGLFYESIARVPLGVALTVEFLGPLGLAAALSRRWRDGAWVGMALAGVFILGAHRSSAALDVVGLTFALGAGVFWAAYIVAGSRLARSGVGTAGLGVATGIAALVIGPIGVVQGGAGLISPHVLLIGAAVAALSPAIPYSCEIAALAGCPSGRSASWSPLNRPPARWPVRS